MAIFYVPIYMYVCVCLRIAEIFKPKGNNNTQKKIAQIDTQILLSWMHGCPWMVCLLDG